MKSLYFLFAVVFLVVQTQSGTTTVAKDEALGQALDEIEAEAQDEVMADDDAAEISSLGLARGGSIACQRRRGVCRGFCWLNEYPSGRCFTGMLCCNRRN